MRDTPLFWGLVVGLFLAILVIMFFAGGCESTTPAENQYTHETERTEASEFVLPAENAVPPSADNGSKPAGPPPAVKKTTTTTRTKLTQTSKGAGSTTAFTKSTSDSKAGAITPVDEKGTDTEGPKKGDTPAVGESGGGITGIVAAKLGGKGGAYMFIGAILMVGCTVAALAFRFPMFWWGTLAGALFFVLGYIMDFAPWVIWLIIALGAVCVVMLVLNGKVIGDIWKHFKTLVSAVDNLPPAQQEPVRDEIQKRAGGDESPGDNSLKEFVAVAKKELDAAAAKVAKALPNIVPKAGPQL